MGGLKLPGALLRWLLLLPLPKRPMLVCVPVLLGVLVAGHGKARCGQ